MDDGYIFVIDAADNVMAFPMDTKHVQIEDDAEATVQRCRPHLQERDRRQKCGQEGEAGIGMQSVRRCGSFAAPSFVGVAQCAFKCN